MSDRERDPYKALGLGRDATGAEVARAYRRLARAVHPDSRPGDPAAATQFRALSDAYGLLSDPARRAAWDHLHPQPARHPRSSGPGGPDLRPFPPAVQTWPAGGPAPGAALRAGPVHIQPPPPGGQQAGPAVGPSMTALLWWLLADGPEWPW
jgi:curved DNA-binding protein CbpA